MSAAAARDEHASAGQAQPGESPQPVAAAQLVPLAEAMLDHARHASDAAKAGDAETVNAISALLLVEPRNQSAVLAVVSAIVGDAMADPFRETTANRWRGLLPSWIAPPLIGATVNRLRAAGLLVATGRYVRSTDTAGRNGNKLQPVYALDLAALPREPFRDQDATGEPA
ncbi:hypothetical protein P3102_22490 [Amycolatopsis sp. QT-25]|uniref:hypothetical protein n=1 Tax=Amycolatopsis sp. QT-25 TaxID=3034022 RepID=UPI0023EBF53A|nr:hypothetical protein [Amycolatopsis sp. QT-25]WET76875.1 hypothetical protein P3102_22490 [Amycolatopsis sp. QT-25]